MGTFGIVLVEMQVKEYILDFLRGGQASGIKIAAVRENSDGLLNIRDGRFRIAGLLGGPLWITRRIICVSRVYSFNVARLCSNRRHPKKVLNLDHCRIAFDDGCEHGDL